MGSFTESSVVGSPWFSEQTHKGDPDMTPGRTLLTACFGTLLVLVDYTAPLTTLTPTAGTLHLGPSAQTWVLTGTLIGLAALLLTMGSAADDHGRKRVFGAGALLLLLSTALSAAAPDGAVFLAGRVLQGCAAAARSWTPSARWR
jgi:MFS family permease